MRYKDRDRYREGNEYYVAYDRYDYYRVDYDEYYVPVKNTKGGRSVLKSVAKWGLRGGLAAAGLSFFV